MPRDVDDLHQVLTAFTGWIRARPEAGIVVGTVRSECPGAFATQIGHSGADPVSLVMLAAEILRTASEMICASPQAEGAAGREVVLRVERALHELGLQQGRAAS